MQLEQSILKAGETIQIVKTVLAMKLQSEQKLVSTQSVYSLRTLIATGRLVISLSVGRASILS